MSAIEHTSLRRPDFIPHEPVFITADDVFNFDKGLLLASPDRNFGADFFNGNHVLQAATKTLNDSIQGVSLNYEVADFIQHIAKFPQLQIPTVDKTRSFKSRLDLVGMMNQHRSVVSQTVNAQMEWAYYEGDNARLKALALLNQTIPIEHFRYATDISLTLPAKEYNPVSLIPLFNITTAVKLSSLFDIPFPQELTDLETTSIAKQMGYSVPSDEI